MSDLRQAPPVMQGTGASSAARGAPQRRLGAARSTTRGSTGTGTTRGGGLGGPLLGQAVT
jgi:hypothetical protein